MSRPHLLVFKALASGKLKKQPCEVCGEVDTVGHHDDYAKPLEVRWLCRTHHQKWHSVHGSGANIDAGASKGARTLGELTRPTTPLGMTVSQLARKLGTSRQAVSGWMTGKALPSAKFLAKLEDETGIPSRDWVRS